MKLVNLNRRLLGGYNIVALSAWELFSAVLFAIAALVFYTFTMHPSMSAGDNGELTVAMFYLGIAHAPSYPIHSFMGKLVTFLPFQSPAWHANFFSALCAALTLFFCMLLYIKVLRSIGLPRVYAILAATIGTIAFMLSETFWAQAGMAEVYTISSIFPPLLLWILLLWQDDVIKNADSPELYFGESYLLAYAFLMGFGLGGHQTLAITEVLGGLHIAFVLIFFQILPRRQWMTTVIRGLPQLLFVLFLVALAWNMYFAHLYSRDVNLYDNNYEHTRKGIWRFVVANLILLAYYLVLRFAPGELIDKNNPYQRAALAIVKFFGMLYLGLTIYLYILIRGHSSPPINWGGIGEELTVWGKLAKFFSIVNRKQFPGADIERTLPNLMYQLRLVVSHLHFMQYSVPMFILMGLGWVYGLLRYPLFMIIFTVGLLAFNFQLTVILNFEPTNQSLSIVEVFYITSYLLLSLLVALGAAAMIQGCHRTLNWVLPQKNNPSPKAAIPAAALSANTNVTVTANTHAASESH